MKKTIWALLICTALLGSVYAEGSATQIKAEYIVELVNNIEWSSRNAPEAGSPVKVGIVGATDLASELQTVAQSSATPIEVSELALTDEYSGYQVLFTGSTDLKELAKFLKKVGNVSACTVSNAKDFARYGVMVNISEDGNSFKYEVNTMVLDGAGLKLKDTILKKADKI